MERPAGNAAIISVAFVRARGTVMDGIGVRRDIDLGDELRKWRVKRKVSLRELGKILHCDHSRVWKIENNRLPMTHEVAELCDAALNTGGALAAVVADAQEVIKPAQLPAAPAWLAGRDEELAALRAGARDRPHGTPTVVAIDGPAGVGKTALALRWAHDIASQYVDGHLFADLRAFVPYSSPDIVTVDDVLEEFLTALGVGAVPATTEQRARLFRSLTAKRRLLVVLDNVYSLEEIAPLLPASAGCGVVVTSRRTLAKLAGQLGGTRVTVQPLREQDATELIRSLIGAPRVEAEIAAVTALTRLCDGLPLMLHTAAEQIAVYPHRQLSGLVQELAEEVPRMSVCEDADIATVFSASYDDLEPAAARVFRLLGLYCGEHLSVEAVAALAGVSVPLVRRLLHPLAAVHLIDIDSSDRVRMLAPVRDYARDLVATEDTDDDRRAAAQRLVIWYIHTARSAQNAITADTNDSPGYESGWLPVVEGVCAQEFFDYANAVAWWETEGVNVSAVTSLASEYGLSQAVQDLGAALADPRVQRRTPAMPSDDVLPPESDAEGSEPSSSHAASERTDASGRTHHDSSALHRYRNGGTNHGPPTDLRVPPVTLTPGTDTDVRSGLHSAKAGRQEIHARAEGLDPEDDDDSGLSESCRREEVRGVNAASNECVHDSSCRRNKMSSSDRQSGGDRWGSDVDVVMCCQRNNDEASAMTVCQRPAQTMMRHDCDPTSLHIPAPRS